MEYKSQTACQIIGLLRPVGVDTVTTNKPQERAMGGVKSSTTKFVALIWLISHVDTSLTYAEPLGSSAMV